MIKLRPKERALSMAVIVPTAVVVVALAVLQYRWSKEASEATGVRLADSLQLSMVNWHLDFFRNFSEVCLTMRIDPKGETSGDVGQFIRQFAEWRSIARYPGLVSNLYLLRSDHDVHPQALRLDPSRQRFEPEPWPATLVQLRPDLERLSSSIPPALVETQTAGQRFGESFYNIGDALRGWRFEPAIPALLHPITSTPTRPPRWRPRLDREQSARAPLHHRDAAGWIVIELSSTVIQSQILPDLAHRYFQGPTGSRSCRWYGKEQRWIGIRACVRENSGGQEVQVGISDRGIGIEPAELPHIFEPFYRSPRASAAQIHGTGLGLTLARRIAEAMRGI